MSSRDTRPARHSVSAQKVAERAGVSRSAVSRTFTEGASVSATTRTKVLRAAEELGYHVNHLARGLMHQRSGIVCILVAELGAPYHSAFVEACIRRMQEIGKVVMVLNTAGDPQNVENALKQSLNYRADATLVVSGSPPATLIQTCIDNGQRVILINRDDMTDGPESIMVDNEAAAQEAYRMLKRAGCRRLVVVSSTAGTPSLTARETAFETQARADGMEIHISREGPTGYTTGAASARALFATSVRPDGVFCVTDLLATGFMDVVRQEFNLSIPGDLCIIGLDDIPEASWNSYRLTTFRQPIEEMAERIATMLATEAPAIRMTRMALQPIWRSTVRP